MTIHNCRAHIPPMGWNSWDCYGTNVREAEVRANAAFMSTQG
jgi:alpha-galactosidase